MKKIYILLILFSCVINVKGEVIDTLTAQKAALFYGNQKWENVSIIDYNLFYDPITELPKAYIFTLDISPIKNDFEQFSSDLSQLLVQSNKDHICKTTISHKSLKDKIISRYGTVVISANDDLPILLLRHGGVHQFYIQNEKLKNNINNVWKNQSVNYNRRYLLNAINAFPSYKKGNDIILFNENNPINKSNIHRKRNIIKKFSKINQKSKFRSEWDKFLKSVDDTQKLKSSSINSTDNLVLGAIIEQGYIDGVPYYNQDEWSNSVCSEVSTAQVLGYWDDLYPNLIDWGNDDFNDNFEGVDDIVRDLMVAMKWNATDWTLVSNMLPGMEEFCNSSTYRNNLDFSFNRDNIVWWSTIKNNINDYRPMVVGIFGDYEDGDGNQLSLIGHAMTLVGYVEEESPDVRLIVVHPNQNGNGAVWSDDFEINFDMPDNGDMIIWKIYPDGEDNINPTLTFNSPNSGGTYSGTIPLNISATDESGIWWIDFQYSTNGINWIDIPSLYNTSHDITSFNHNFNSISSIEYAENVWIRARSVDNWGQNTSEWDVIDNPITIDNRAPQPSYIVSSVQLTPSSGVEPNSSVTVSGTALYDLGTNVTGLVEISAGDNTWTASINNGSFSRDIYAPENSGYVTVWITDGTLEATNQAYLSVMNEGNGDNFNFYRSAMCQDVESSDPYDPINETHYFRSDDEIAYCWTHMTNLYTPVRIRWEWDTPDGTNLDNTYSSWTDDPADSGYDYWYWWKLWSGYYISGHQQSDREGRHSVNIFAREEGGSYEFMESQYYIISYDFKEHVLCKNIVSDNPSGETNTFYQNDTRVYTWSRYTDVSESVVVRTEWYEPNGTMYYTDDYSLSDPGQGYYYPDHMQWSWININGFNAENKCGDWEIRKYEQDPWGNWDLLYSEKFKILESPNVQPQLNTSVSDENSYEDSDIIININSTDNTYIKKVILYWNDGTEHQTEWDNIFSSSHYISYNIGQYTEGTAIQYWAKIFDSSGNMNETDRKVLTVKDSDTTGPIISNIQITEYNGNNDGVIQDNEQIRISCNASDPSGINQINFYIDELQVVLNGNYYAITGPFDVGGHAVVVTGIDNDNSPGYATIYESFEVVSSLYLNVTPSSRSVGSSLGMTTFNVSSNVEWSVSESSDWLTTVKTNATTLSVSYDENSDTEERSASISISGMGVSPQTVTVIQEAAPYLDASPQRTTIPYDYECCTYITVESNTSWNVISNASWLTVDYLNGSESRDIRLETLNSNTSANPRHATLTISAEGLTSKELTVTQEAAPYLDASPQRTTIPYDYECCTYITVESNTSWNVISNASWLTVDYLNGSGSRDIRLETLNSNTSANPRIGTLTFTGDGIDLPRTVAVTQNGNKIINVSETDITIWTVPGSRRIDIESNVDWSVQHGAEWLSIEPMEGSGDGTIRIEVINPNITSDERTSVVKVSGDGGVPFQDIYVTQPVTEFLVEFESAPPGADICAQNGQGYYQYGERVRLEATPCDENGYEFSHWRINWSNIVYENPTWITVTDDCWVYVFYNEVSTTTVDKIKVSDEISIYPNPTEGTLFIITSVDSPGDYTIKLIDYQGQVLKTDKIKGLWVNENYNFDISSFNSGPYIIEIESKEFRKRIKTVKE
ncbi:MAG: T9SS type A sorting domain-containing protein [Marinilabiliaceae bacterium]|nr:T9SS type A sorting domain-containing protein [Marinilabiliaceae bacterium]